MNEHGLGSLAVWSGFRVWGWEMLQPSIAVIPAGLFTISVFVRIWALLWDLESIAGDFVELGALSL